MSAHTNGNAWLFLTGAADYPDEIGSLKYVLVALYWALLIGSCLLAAINWRDDPSQRRDWTQQLEKYAAFAPHRALVTHVFLPNLAIIIPLVFLAEISFAISLMLGIGVRFFATLAVLYALHLWFGLYLHPGEWPWEYVFIVVIHVLFVAYPAGRSLGADALLRKAAHQGIVANVVAVAT